MKKLILILLIIIFPLLLMGQLSINKESLLLVNNVSLSEHKIDLKLDIKYSGIESNEVGPLILMAGSAFILGGLFTKPDKEYINGKWVRESFINQGPRFISIVTGSCIFIGGIVYIINNN